MAKKTQQQRNTELSIARSRFEHDLSRRDVKYQLDRIKAPPKPPFSGHPLNCPDHFSIYEVEDDDKKFLDTIKFIKNVRRNFAKEECILDFTATTRLTAAGVLVLYATMENCWRSGSEKSALRFSPIPMVSKQIRTHKLHKLAKKPISTASIDPSKPLQVVAGTGKGSFEEIIDYIKIKVFEKDLTPKEESILSAAVSETINNVTRHAYPDLAHAKRHWWLIAEVFSGNELFLAIYDTGVGIPKTVVTKSWFSSRLVKTFPKLHQSILEEAREFKEKTYSALIPKRVSDAELIYLSMQGDITKESSSKHGQGSKSIRGLVNSTKNGKLWVFSNKGLCKYSEGESSPMLYDLPRRFPGTLIQWNITL